MQDKPADLNERSPRLTTDLTEQKHPQVCQACGGSNVPGMGNGLMRLSVDRWQEHDHNDKPELAVVVLCHKCAERIIKPHPRLYAKLAANAPWAGCMTLCLDCKHRTGVTCSHAAAQVNGGRGVAIRITQPTRGFVDGPAYRGPFHFYPDPPQSCDQKETIKL